MSIWTKDKRSRYIKEGRGAGVGKDYIPWTKTHDFSSKGRATRIFGIKSNRIHHLHSDLQLRAFLMYEWNEDVIDIRECFPLLDVMEVIDNKEDLRLDKFCDGEPLVLTTNFLLTIRDPNGKERYIARSIKDSSELTRKITFEKMEIENRYWRAKGIEWKITTDKQLLRQFAKNIEWVRETMLVTESNEVDKDQLSVTLLNHLLNNHEFILSDILKDFDKREGASKGAGLYLFRFLLAKKEIKINMRNKIDLSLRVKDLMT